ncbi:MAG TPA: alpha/beta hydrolase [Aquabacterium sp.]|nr:alpha/beta hydrolase [Aquabacterium sp.]
MKALRPPVVLVHGMWSRQETWGATRHELTRQGIEVLSYELPQHGARFTDTAALGRLGVQDYVDDLVAWVQAQSRPPVLVGHSMGGLVSLMAASRLQKLGTPAPGLILVTPATPAGGWLFSWRNLPVFLRPCLTQLFGGRAFSLTSSEAAWGLFHDVKAEQRDALIQSLQPESGLALMQIAWWFLDPKGSTNLNWDDVHGPVRVYLGGRDRIVPVYAARVLKRLKDVQIDVHPASSHMVFDDNAQAHFFSWLVKALNEWAS